MNAVGIDVSKGHLLPHSTASALRRQKTRLAAVPFTVSILYEVSGSILLISTAKNELRKAVQCIP